MSKKDGIIKPVELPTLNFHQFNAHVKFTKSHPVGEHGETEHRVSMVNVRPSDGARFPMGDLHWNADTGEIKHLETLEDYQRLGIANTMLSEAKETAKEHGLVSPVHSSNRTDEGQAWAKSTKEKLPRRKRVNYFN